MPILRSVVVMSLTEVHERIVLRRVSDGRIAMFQGSYFDHGCRVPDYLPAVVESLIERELAVLAEAGADLWRRVTLTPAGHAHYQALCAQSQRRPDPPPGNPPPWVGADPAGHRVSPQGVRPGSALAATTEPVCSRPRTRWVYVDSCAHVLDDNRPVTALLTRCGQTLDPMVPIYSVLPCLDECPRCAPFSAIAVPQPEFPKVF